MLACCEFSFGPDIIDIIIAFCEFSFGPDIIITRDIIIIITDPPDFTTIADDSLTGSKAA